MNEVVKAYEIEVGDSIRPPSGPEPAGWRDWGLVTEVDAPKRGPRLLTVQRTSASGSTRKERFAVEENARFARQVLPSPQLPKPGDLESLKESIKFRLSRLPHSGTFLVEQTMAGITPPVWKAFSDLLIDALPDDDIHFRIDWEGAYHYLKRNVVHPPPGWFAFGTHAHDKDVQLDFWGDEGGVPIWERPVRPVVGYWKILVTGSREFTDGAAIERALLEQRDEHPDERLIVIQGAAEGADTLAAQIARELPRFSVVAVPALWEKEGRSGLDGAGPARNRAMLALEPDIVLAFPKKGAGNRGTQGMVIEALSKGVPTVVFQS